MNPSRRDFIKQIGLLSAAGSLATWTSACSQKPKNESDMADTAGSLFFKISLAEWSLHKTIQSGELNHLDFPAVAKNEFNIDAVEFVNGFFKDKANDTAYLNELKTRCSDLGVASLLIMCDGEGEMASPEANRRKEAVENHFKWVEAARFLGCQSIRVNCFGSGTREEMAKASTESLRALSEFAQPLGINVIVENHGGFSSDGQWLGRVIRDVDLPNCGTLPDFGNFCMRREKGDMWESPCVEWYDRYQGVTELMPFAKGVSAKSYEFDANGNSVEIDYPRMLQIVKAAGYTGYIGIEYEGSGLPEKEGIKATKKLLERSA
ncbi:MAG: sugar phosphate isomerase/epimerase family protein [Cyclobacteriaceae bacterium]